MSKLYSGAAGIALIIALTSFSSENFIGLNQPSGTGEKVFILDGEDSFMPVSFEETCLDLVKIYIDKMSKIDKPLSNKVYYMNMSTKIEPSAHSKQSPSEVNAEVFLTNTQMTYETDKISVYQDTIDAFMVVHPTKQIVWSKGGQNANLTIDQIRMGEMQKALLEGGKIKDCKDVEYNGHKMKMLLFMPAAKIKEQFKLEEVSFYYDQAEKRVAKIIVNYNAAYSLKRQSITYNKLDFNYKGWKASSARSRIMTSKGDLLPKFKNYTLVKSK